MSEKLLAYDSNFIENFPLARKRFAKSGSIEYQSLNSPFEGF